MHTSVLILLILPLFSFLTVKEISIFSRENKNNNEKDEFYSVKSWTRNEVLKDPKFYTMLPTLLAPAFIITGIVINQSFIIESKGWGEYAIAKAFMFYSVFTVLTLFLSGFLVDKFTSKRMLPILNIPLLLSLITLILLEKSYSAFIFMGLLGITNGLTNVLLSSLWAEIYGVNYLGSIKALTGSLMVFSTALATVVFGILIDLQYSIESIAVLCSFYTALSIVLVLFFQKKYKPIMENKTWFYVFFLLFIAHLMARITVEDCLKKIDSQYDLVLLAKERTSQLNAGEKSLVPEDNDKNTVISLREIGDGKVSIKNLEDSAINKLRKQQEETVVLEGIEDDEKEDSFDQMYKGEVSKSGAAILPSKRVRRIPDKTSFASKDKDKKITGDDNQSEPIEEEIKQEENLES